MESRRLLNASVSGTVYNDPTGVAGTSGGGGSGLAGITVYVDSNNNGKLDAGEVSAVTAADGTYTLPGVPAGAQIIRQNVPSGLRQSYPAMVAGNHISVGSSNVAGVNFDDTITAYISGVVYADTNGNKKQDSGEPGLGGVTIVISTGSQTAAAAVGAFTAITNTTGGYSFSGIAAGTYNVIEGLPAGYLYESAGTISLTVGSGATDTSVNFADGAVVPQTSSTLSGTVIGTPGSYDNDGNTIAKAFDGNLNNFFDGPTANGNYAGLDLGTASVISQISYAPRIGFNSRMVGGTFQGSDSADFSSALTTLYTVTTAPDSGVFTTVSVASEVPFRYVRYVSPAGSYGDVAEIHFTGYVPAAGATLDSSGTLTIYGSAGNDTITGNFVPYEGVVITSVNGTSRTFSGSAINAVVVAGQAGNDSIALTDQSYNSEGDYTAFGNGVPLTLNGGDGNDTLSAEFSDAAEFPVINSFSIDGGAGDDQINLEGEANATIHGGDGNDAITATDDNGYLNGYAYVYGDEGINTLIAGGYTPGYEYITLAGGIARNGYDVEDPDDFTNISYADESFGLTWDTSTILGTVTSEDSGAPIPNATVYLDINKDGILDAGDISTTTDADGVYSFTNLDDENLSEFTYSVRLVPPTGFGYTATSPQNFSEPLALGEGVSGDDFSLVSVSSALTQLTGTTIGTAGSYNSDGNTIAKATDGNLATFFDGPTANGNYVGLDLGDAGGVVTEVKFASRSGWTSRMNGGEFQASDSATFASGVVTLYTIASNANPSSSNLNTETFANSTAYRYYRYLSPASSYGDISEFQIFGSAGGLNTGPAQLTGTTIGTAGSYQSDGNTIANATDGNLVTFFDGPTANGNWVGLDLLGSTQTIGQIEYAPRSGWTSRMVGGEFQVSTTANFSSGVTTLYTITATPPAGALTTVTLSSPVTARYVRYLSPGGSYGDIAEFQVFA